MTLFIYVLLLSIWTSTCFNTSQSNVSSTVSPTVSHTVSPTISPSAGATQLQSMETKMDGFRKRLLVIITGVMIIAFIFTCFCFLHHNCMSDDVPKGNMIKKEGIVAKSSKLSPSESKTASPCSPEKQSMLSCRDKLSQPSSPAKSSIPSSAEKLLRPSSPQKSSIPSSTEMLLRASSPEKSSIPSSAGKLLRLSSPEKSSRPSIGKSSRPSIGKSSRPTSLEEVFRSSYLEKLPRTSSIEKTYKLTHTRKQVSRIYLSYSDKPVRPRCPPCPQNQIWPPESSSLPKLAKPPRHPNPKRSGSRDKTDMLSRPLLPKTCRCYKERCLVCKTSEPLLNEISEAKNNIAQTLPFSSEVKYLSQSFHKVDSMDNALCNDVSDIDMMTHDSDDDSDREITIICNIKHNELLPMPTRNK